MKTKEHSGQKKIWIRAFVVLFWLIVWEILALCLDSDILLASPIKVFKTLFNMLFTKELYSSVAFSFGRISLGFILAFIFSVLFGFLSYRFSMIREILSLPVAVVKATPVASFIILVLVWIPSRNLSVFISFFMAFPILYTNILEGLKNTDSKLLEMASVFNIGERKTMRYIYIPTVIPFVRAGLELALGMCVKAGIAAEIIGLSKGSVGERLYEAKIYLETPELFAWTFVIIFLSFFFTKLVLKLSDILLNVFEGRKG